MKKYLFIACAFLLLSCGSSKKATTTPAVTQMDLDRGRKTYPDLTMETLLNGKDHFEKQCSQCHGLKNPKSKNEEEWKAIVPKMVSKANKKAGTEVITAEMSESIQKYLITMSTK